MNETINLPRLIALVAERADIQPAEARKFLHELFAEVEAALLEGESVKIKGVGEFVRGEDPASPVLFKADDELAAIANEPFAAFEAVELNEGAAEEIMKVELEAAAHVESKPETKPGPQPDVVAAPTPEEQVSEKAPAAESETVSETDDAGQVESDEVAAEAEKDECAESDDATDDSEPEVDEASDDKLAEPDAIEGVEEKIVYVQQSSNHSMWLMLGALIGLIVGLVGGYFAGKYMAHFELPEEEMALDEDTLAVVSDFVQPVDTVVKRDTIAAVNAEEVPRATPAEALDTKPAKSEPVYDTVSSRRYLAIIAGEHYGVKNYWIFIYNANPDLGDPNKIAPGTKVLVPAKESFMEPTKAETDAKASRLLNELSKKYKL